MGRETPTIKVTIRERTGTRYAKRLRETGRLPAVIYGGSGEPTHISVDATEAINHLKDGVHVIDVDIDGGATDTCLLKELQFGYLGDNLVHIDFTRVDLNQMVTVNIPVNLTGTPAGTKAEGAMLAVIRSEIEVRCKVKDIPSEITFDITEMMEVLTIGELNLPDGVEALLDPEKHICHIEVQAEITDDDAEATEADGGEAQPEVITEKPDDSEEGKGEGPS